MSPSAALKIRSDASVINMEGTVNRRAGRTPAAITIEHRMSAIHQR
jgi:hypothetical protein